MGWFKLYQYFKGSSSIVVNISINNFVASITYFLVKSVSTSNKLYNYNWFNTACATYFFSIFWALKHSHIIKLRLFSVRYSSKKIFNCINGQFDFCAFHTWHRKRHLKYFRYINNSVFLSFHCTRFETLGSSFQFFLILLVLILSLWETI